LAIVLVTIAVMPSAWAQDERLDSLTIEGNVFTNVTIISRTATHISFKHQHGFSSVKLAALPAKEQTKVGYEPPAPPKTMMQRTRDYFEWVNDPRVKALATTLETDIRGEVDRIIAENDTIVMRSALGGVVCIYFLFCLAVVKICKKTTVRPGLAAWLPGFQFISLLKAAGMSPWCYLLLYIPPINIFIMIKWCFRICRTRQKSPAIGFLLLIPVVNILPFFYLAFSSQKSAVAARNQPMKLKLSFHG
jgi:hypothetical protein